MSSLPYFKVMVEIPAQGLVKYEYDLKEKHLYVDRFLATSMCFPCNYGYILNTIAGDGDPLDVLVITPHALHPGVVVPCRAIGVLQMHDEKGSDEKILALPSEKLTTLYSDIQKLSDIPLAMRQMITHFFTCYKQNDKNKWVEITGWKDLDEAYALIRKFAI